MTQESDKPQPEKDEDEVPDEELPGLEKYEKGLREKMGPIEPTEDAPPERIEEVKDLFKKKPDPNKDQQ
jgi:hypothetical protein